LPLYAYTRTACKYGGKNIAFRVNEGSTNFWLSLLVEFEDGEGDIGSMQIKQVTDDSFLCHFPYRFRALDPTTLFSYLSYIPLHGPTSSI
jgi:hypothetical protein